jgi:hypothetical protein
MAAPGPLPHNRSGGTVDSLKAVAQHEQQRKALALLVRPGGRLGGLRGGRTRGGARYASRSHTASLEPSRVNLVDIACHALRAPPGARATHKNAAQLVQHPVAGRGQALQVLLGTANHISQLPAGRTEQGRVTEVKAASPGTAPAKAPLSSSHLHTERNELGRCAVLCCAASPAARGPARESRAARQSTAPRLAAPSRGAAAKRFGGCASQSGCVWQPTPRSTRTRSKPGPVTSCASLARSAQRAAPPCLAMRVRNGRKANRRLTAGSCSRRHHTGAEPGRTGDPAGAGRCLAGGSAVRAACRQNGAVKTTRASRDCGGEGHVSRPPALCGRRGDRFFAVQRHRRPHCRAARTLQAARRQRQQGAARAGKKRETNERNTNQRRTGRARHVRGTRLVNA